MHHEGLHTFGVNMERKTEQCPELIRLICIFLIVQV